MLVLRLFFFQLYVNSDLSKTEALLRSTKELGSKVPQVTIDAPVPGKRAADERIAAENLVILCFHFCRSHTIHQNLPSILSFAFAFLYSVDVYS